MYRARSTGVETFGNGLGTSTGAVAEHHGCTGVVKTFTKCRPNPTACAGDKSDRTDELHSTMLWRACVSVIMEDSGDNLSTQASQKENTLMTETIQKSASHDFIVIAEAISVIDKALSEIGGRQLVSTTEVADLLLDVRQLLSEKAEPASAVAK